MSAPDDRAALDAAETMVHRCAEISPASAEQAGVIHKRIQLVGQALRQADAAAGTSPSAIAGVMEETQRLLGAVEEIDQVTARHAPGLNLMLRVPLLTIRAYGEGMLLHVDEVMQAHRREHEVDGLDPDGYDLG